MRGDALSGPPAWGGRDGDAWATEIGVPRLELHSQLPSTNAHIRALAAQGAPPLTTVVAHEQSAGHGREGRSWHSPPDTGLWLSILLSLDSDGTAGVLPLAVGVAVARAIEGMSGVGVGLKWPNDVLIGDRKVAGILCESVGPGRLVAAGIGVNLRRPPEGYPGDLDDAGGFLDEISNKETAEPDLAAAIVAELRSWAQPVPRTLSGRLRMEWESRDRLCGRIVRLESGVQGTASGVTMEGSLSLVETDGSKLAVRAGSVRVAGGRGSGALYVAGTGGSNEGSR